jgi:hypothetical protein
MITFNLVFIFKNIKNLFDLPSLVLIVLKASLNPVGKVSGLEV